MLERLVQKHEAHQNIVFGILERNGKEYNEIVPDFP